MSYRWSNRRFWKSWLKRDFRKFWFKFRYGWSLGGNGTMHPQTGKGKYVSVYSKGGIIQIIDEEGEYDEIRIIPCQHNHGVMVEKIINGKVNCRNHLDIGQLNKNIIFASNVEQLANKKTEK
jgi:hypothetical protein